MDRIHHALGDPQGASGRRSHPSTLTQVRFTPLIAAVIAGAMLAAGCGADLEVAIPDPTPGPDQVEADAAEPTPTPPPTPAPTPAGRAELPEGQLFEMGPRVAVETAAGQIFTILGDGSNPVPLTNPDEGTRNALPTWSGDAGRLAWVTIDDDSSSTSWVRSARFDGSEWFEQATPDRPFTLTWDPSSSQIATLSPSDLGTELGVVSLVDGDYRAVDDGSPFWFSWNPEADGFLVHASGVRLDFVPLEGSSQVLEPLPGAFQTPRWLEGAVELVYADEQDGEDFLVVAGREGAGRRALATYDGYLQFTVSAEAGLIAFQVIDESRAPAAQVITAAFQDDFEDIVDVIPQDQLTIIATFGGEPFVLYPSPDDFTPSPVVAFYWSPDGSSLAWLLQVDGGDGDCASETALYEVQFWTGNSIIRGPRFRPTATFACDYVPFFDQLDQGVRFWSPDGQLFTYAGTDQLTGDRGIWTFRPGAFEGATKIANGEIGVWSPDNAGSAAASAL